MKIIKSIVFLSLCMIGFATFSTEEASAAYGPWNTLPDGSGCKVRVYNDASTYTTSATSIDWYVENNGSSGCGTLYYKAYVGNLSYDGPYYGPSISSTQSGYFKNSSPLKKFNISSLSKTGVNASIFVDIYRDSSYSKFLGDVQGATFRIDKR